MAIFPNVPNVPGVPPLPRQFGQVVQIVELMVADNLLALFGLLNTSWGIYFEGVLAVAPDNVVDLGYRDTFSIPTYPIERGTFESYNKVDNPFDVRIRMSCGGDISRRQQFLDIVDEIVNSFNLYDVVTPVRTYTNVNFKHIDYRQTATSGNGLIIVDLGGQEIRETAVATFSQTQTPSAASTIGAGNVQARPATSGEQVLAGMSGAGGLGGTGRVGANDPIEVRPGSVATKVQ